MAIPNSRFELTVYSALLVLCGVHPVQVIPIPELLKSKTLFSCCFYHLIALINIFLRKNVLFSSYL